MSIWDLLNKKDGDHAIWARVYGFLMYDSNVPYSMHWLPHPAAFPREGLSLHPSVKEIMNRYERDRAARAAAAAVHR